LYWILGLGVRLDYNEAMEWYLKAAKQGNVNAQRNIGGMYQKGHGVEQNYHQAMEWFLKAANQGVLKMIWGRCIVMEKE